MRRHSFPLCNQSVNVFICIQPIVFFGKHEIFCIMASFSLHLVYIDLVDLNIVATAAATAATSFRLINSF